MACNEAKRTEVCITNYSQPEPASYFVGDYFLRVDSNDSEPCGLYLLAAVDRRGNVALIDVETGSRWRNPTNTCNKLYATPLTDEEWSEVIGAGRFVKAARVNVTVGEQ